MKNLSIKTKLLAGFGIVMALAGITCLTAFFSVAALSGNIDNLLGKRIPQLDSQAAIIQAIYDSSLRIDEAILAADMETTMKELDATSRNKNIANENMEKLKASVQSEKGRQFFQAIYDKRKPYLQVRDKVVALLKEGRKKEAAATLNELKPLREAYFGSLKDMAAFSHERVKSETTDALSKVGIVKIIIMILMVVATAITAVVAFGIIRSITKPLKEAVDTANQLAEGNLAAKINVTGNDEIGELLKAMDKMIVSFNSMISKILSTANDTVTSVDVLRARTERIKEGSIKQAGQAAHIATAAEEMSQTIIDIARNSTVASETSSEAMERAIRGKDVVEGAITTVSRVHESSEELSAMIAKLNDRVNEIGSIVTVINDIADQTNLLALNAAIEAARAGEQGRGFAVVADEVRKLAERTIKATAEISDKIGAVQVDSGETARSMESASKEVSSAADYMKQAGELLNNIVDGVSKVNDQITQIATAVEEQSSASEEVSKNIEQTSGIAKEMESMSVETMSEVNNLTRVSDDLRNATSGFTVDGNNLMILDLAKTDHRIFVGKIAACLKSGQLIDPATLPDHHSCRFGKWYDSEGRSRCGHLPTFSAIDAPHAKIHAMAKEMIVYCQNGDKQRASQLYGEIEGLSEQIASLIDRLKNDCDGRR